MSIPFISKQYSALEKSTHIFRVNPTRQIHPLIRVSIEYQRTNCSFSGSMPMSIAPSEILSKFTLFTIHLKIYKQICQPFSYNRPKGTTDCMGRSLDKYSVLLSTAASTCHQDSREKAYVRKFICNKFTCEKLQVPHR